MSRHFEWQSVVEVTCDYATMCGNNKNTQTLDFYLMSMI